MKQPRAADGKYLPYKQAFEKKKAERVATKPLLTVLDGPYKGTYAVAESKDIGEGLHEVTLERREEAKEPTGLNWEHLNKCEECEGCKELANQKSRPLLRRVWNKLFGKK